MPSREEELRKVLALSETEEAARKREEEARLKRLEEQNAAALFDDSLQMCVLVCLERGATPTLTRVGC